MSDLKTLYFPWALIQRTDTLKKALVFFDKVLLVCEERALDSLEEGLPNLSGLRQFLDETRALRDQGFLEVVSPEAVMAPEDARSLLYASVIEDLRDPRLLAIPTPFEVYGDDRFLVNIGNDGAIATLNYFLIDFYAQDYMTFKREHGYAATFMFKKLVEYDLPPRIRKLYSPLLRETGRSVAQFAQAFAISQALLLSHMHGAALFTDDSLWNEYLRLKYERALANLDRVERGAARKPVFPQDCQSWLCSSALTRTATRFVTKIV